MEKLLELLEQDCTMPVGALAAAAGVSEADAKAAIKKYEDDRTILGYQAIIDWHRTRNGVEGLAPEHIGYENGVLGGGQAQERRRGLRTVRQEYRKRAGRRTRPHNILVRVRA